MDIQSTCNHPTDRHRKQTRQTTTEKHTAERFKTDTMQRDSIQTPGNVNTDSQHMNFQQCADRQQSDSWQLQDRQARYIQQRVQAGSIMIANNV